MASIAARTAVMEFSSAASWSRGDDRSLGEDTIRTDGTTVKLANLGESVSAQYFLFQVPDSYLGLPILRFFASSSTQIQNDHGRRSSYRLSHLLFLTVSHHGQPEPPA
jgi:hypothetical protein